MVCYINYCVELMCSLISVDKGREGVNEHVESGTGYIIRGMGDMGRRNLRQRPSAFTDIVR